MQKHHHHHSSSPSASKRDLYLPSSTVTQVCVTIFNLLALGLGIWSVESLLLRNEASQTRGAESEWTFGQISATILLVGPGFTFMRLLRMRIFGPSHDHPPSLDREGMPIREMGTSGGTENEEKQQARSVIHISFLFSVTIIRIYASARHRSGSDWSRISRIPHFHYSSDFGTSYSIVLSAKA